MAYLYRRPGRAGSAGTGRCEIREAHSTPKGPRSRTLVSFRGALTPELLARAEARARRPFDREALRRRARALGLAVPEARADPAARELAARLRRGQPLDPRLAALLQDQLAGRPHQALPESLADVAEWVGADDAERGRALRDLLRLYDAIARAREPVREGARGRRFPRFSSGEARAAS